jgi:hypothetical protein
MAGIDDINAMTLVAHASVFFGRGKLRRLKARKFVVISSHPLVNVAPLLLVRSMPDQYFDRRIGRLASRFANQR